MSGLVSPPVLGHLALVGAATEVPLVTGDHTRYKNLDYAASTPALVAVADAVNQFLPHYSSVHRGAGYKSQLSTAAYEGARAAVHAFFDARPDDCVVFVRNTTDAMNLLAESVPAGTSVVAFASEHHANLLPWQKVGSVRYLPAPASAGEAVEVLEAHLRTRRTDLVAVTGISNVTGEVWPVAELTSLAHAYGARLVLDAAQLAPHLPVSIGDLGVDYLAASGHKMYAPFGVGVLIGRPDWLARGAPYMRGGGAVDFVTTDEVLWTALPDRQEAGSPNVLGAVAMGVAAETLRRYGMARVAEDERRLGAYARQRLGAISAVEMYRLWPESADRIGLVTFNVAGFDHSLLAAILSAEYGIGVRHGCFCAHPLMLTLLRITDLQAQDVRDDLRVGRRARVPGAVRLSLGVGSSADDIDALADAIASIVHTGPRWNYALDEGTGDYLPAPDPRSAPPFRFLLSWARPGGGESS
jgi:selenocysteine lyase/cysteine desulfurase